MLIINQIIANLHQSQLGFKNEKFHVPVLYFAGDGLMKTTDRQEMEEMLNFMITVSEEFGLKINKRKSQCMIINRN